MRHKFILRSRTHKEEKDKQMWTLKYGIPNLIEDLTVELKIKTEDPYLVAEELCIPVELGDSIVFNTGEVNTQTKIEEKEEVE